MEIFIKSLRITISGLFLLVSFCSQSQMKPAEEFEYYKAKYPNESVVIIKKFEDVFYELDGDSLITKVRRYEESIQLSENAMNYAGDKVFSSSFSTLEDIEAYTLLPQKRKYEKVEVTDFKESYDKKSSVFYDDTKETTFTYPALQQGAKMVVEYTKIIKDPKMIGKYYFNTYLPVETARYTVSYPSGVQLNPQFFNLATTKIDREEKQTDGINKMIFTSTDNKKIKFDSRCPSYDYLATSMYAPVGSYTLKNGTTKEVITTPDNLHQWYRTFLKDLHTKDNDLNELVSTIVTPEDPVMDKVQKIYYWVQSNIKYIAFEDGMRGLVPHSGKYVADKRYGDCKDMASIIVSMLRETNIEAQYTWVGSRDLPYKYSATPSPITDNHMIATFTHEGNTYYLDATGQYTPIDLPTSMLQGKECLISLDENNYRIHEIPVIDKERNVMTDSVKVTLVDGVVEGTGSVNLTGYAKVFNTYRLIKSNTKRIDDYLDRLLEKGNNKFQLVDYELNNVADLTVPTTINYNFNIPDYYRAVGDNIYINLALDKTMTDALIENREVSLENEYKYINRSVVSLEIPEGYTVKNLPENASGSNKNFGFNLTYEVLQNEIIVTKEFYEDYLILDPEAFEDWNEVITAYSKACRKAITLTSTID